MENKKILIISVKSGAIGGGVSKIVEKLYLELSVNNTVEQWALLTGDKRNENWKELEKKKYLHTRKLTDLGRIFHNYKTIYTSKNIKKILSNIKGFDYIIVTDPFAIPFINVKDEGMLIFQIHSSLREINAYTLQVKYILNMYNKKIDKVTCGDEVDINYLKKYKFKSVVLNNFPTVEYKGYQGMGNRKLVYFGLIQKFKRIAELSRWAYENKIHLDIYGKVVDYTDEEIDNMKNEYVTIHSQMYNSLDIVNNFSNYSAFVINSMVEGKTMAVSEAIAVGLPVVINKKLINVDEMLCNHGVDLEDVEKVRTLLKEEEFNKDIYIKQSKVIKAYTYENYVKNLF